MQADLVFVAERDRHSALRVLRGRLSHFALGQHQHASGGGQIDGGAHSRNPRAHHDVIGLGRH